MIRGIHHTALSTPNLDRMLAFYRDLLGFEVVEQDAEHDDCSWVWLRHGTANLMLNGMYEPGARPAAPDVQRAKAHADTGLYIGADVDAVYAYLRARDVEVAEPVVRDYGWKQLGVEDPDGYKIELVQRD